MKNHLPVLLLMPRSLACLSSLALISQCHLLDQQSQVIFLRKLHSCNTGEIKGLLRFLASSLSFSPPSPFKAALPLDVPLWSWPSSKPIRPTTQSPGWIVTDPQCCENNSSPDNPFLSIPSPLWQVFQFERWVPLCRQKTRQPFVCVNWSKGFVWSKKASQQSEEMDCIA